jgi:macrodomain Ter protein organizer (MatP/YcbG family)
MMYWPVGDFYDDTTRLLGINFNGFSNRDEAQAVIDELLAQQHKPHHVSYRVVQYMSFAELQENGVLT